MNPFEFAEPESLEEAVALLTEEPGRAEVIAGGTDLLSELKDGSAEAPAAGLSGGD